MYKRTHAIDQVLLNCMNELYGYTVQKTACENNICFYTFMNISIRKIYFLEF